MIINHNLSAINTHRQLAGNTAGASKSIEKLSSGLRINRAGDDAAGLAISEKMRSQIRGLEQASRNSQDAISMIQTAEGALSETHSILQRMRELAVQSANGTNTGTDRKSIQDEINKLADEINRIGNTTEFNTQKLINGSKDKTEKVAAVKNATSIAKIGTGLDKFEVRTTATNGAAAGAVLDGSVTIHQGTEATYTFGKVTSTGGADTAYAAAITPGANELTISINGTVRTIILDDTAATDALVATDLESKLEAAFNRAADGGAVESGAALSDFDFTVSYNGGKLVIKDDTANKGANSRIDIIGGNAASVLSDASDLKAYGEAANNVLKINYMDGGVAKSVNATIADGPYNTAKEFADAIETAADAALGGDAGKIKFDAAVGPNKNIEVTTTLSGAGNGVVSFGGTAAAFTGLISDGSSITLGKNANNQFDVQVDGKNYTATIAAGDYITKEDLAGAIQKSINDQITALGGASAKQVTVKALEVADTDRVRFQVTSGLEGEQSTIKFSTVLNNDGLKDLGFDTGLVKGQDGQDASVSFHIGANADQNLALAMGDMRSKSLGITSSSNSANQTSTLLNDEVVDVGYSSNKVKNGTADEYVIDVTSKEAANSAITVINNAIEMVSQERSKLGANQNRLEHTINNLETSAENLTAAESRIRDVDMAKEMMNFTKNNILNQAAQAMLAQANQQPQGVLQLLR